MPGKYYAAVRKESSTEMTREEEGAHIARSPLSTSRNLNVVVVCISKLEAVAVFKYAHTCVHVAVPHQACMQKPPVRSCAAR